MTRETLAWLTLGAAGLFEMGWAVGVKYTHGFTRLWPTIGTALAMILSLYLLSRAVQVIPLGTAYAIWTGIGATGTVLFGMMVLDEPRHALRVLCLFMIIAGMIGLNLYSNG